MSGLNNQNTNPEQENQANYLRLTRWQSLILSGEDPIYVSTQKERTALMTAFKRMGIPIKSKETNHGIKVWRVQNG